MSMKPRWVRLLKVVLVACGVLFGVLVLLVAFAGSVYWFEQRRLADDLPPPVASRRVLRSFTLADPYAYPGQWYKVQLHAHTSRSLDSRLPPSESLAEYRRQGFDFLFISDHDVATPASLTGPDGRTPAGKELIVLPAVESTVPLVLPFIGQHLLRLFDTHPVAGGAQARIAATRRAGGLAVLAHPAWEGNAGAGRWLIRDVTHLAGYSAIEVVSPYADWDADLRIWQAAAVRRGPRAPVWLTAADDSHRRDMIGKAWVMVKAERRSGPALKAALARGSFYPTTGATPSFGVRAGELCASAKAPLTVRFVDARGAVRAQRQTVAGGSATYRPVGDEVFVRMEVSAPDGRRAWSQPFWLVQGGTGQ